MIFIMAGTGQVGRATIDSLISQGIPASAVVAGTRDVQKATGLPADVQIRRADYKDRLSMEVAFRGSETLILIPTKTMPAPRCVEHGNALDAAKAAGVKRIVFLSLQAATPQSLFIVASFILFAESATRLCGLEWTIARMSLYTDPVAEWVPDLVRMGRLPYPVTDARIAFVSRANIANSLAVIARRADLNGRILELTGPAALSMPELANVISDSTGAPIRFETITDAEYREMCRKDRLPEEIIEILSTMYRAAEAQEFSHVSPAVELLTGKPAESVGSAISRLQPMTRGLPRLEISTSNTRA